MSLNSNKKEESFKTELEKLPLEEWEEPYRRLELYAGRNHYDLANYGIDHNDLIQEAICGVLSEKRVSRPPDYTLFSLMCGIIKSNAFNHRRKIKNRIKHNSQSTKLQVASIENSLNTKIDFPIIMEKIEKAIINDEQLSFYHQFVKGDPKIKLSKYAENSDFTIEQVRNIKKRYKRFVLKIYKKFFR